MPHIADKCAYEDNDCYGYFGEDVTDFNKGRKQGQAQAKGDCISCRKSKKFGNYCLAFCLGFKGNVLVTNIGIDNRQYLRQHHGAHICYSSC